MIAAYLTDALRGVLENVFQPADEIGSAPVAVVDLRHVIDPAEGAMGFVYPAGTDLRWLDKTPASVDSLAHSGAVDVGVSTWEITLVGARRDPVEIVDMRPVRDGACTPPLGGIFESNDTQGASEKIVLYTAVDRPSPRMFLTSPLAHDDAEPFFATKKITLPKGEKNVVRVRAVTGGQHCAWRLRLEYLTDHGRENITVSAPGDRPFEVTGHADQTYDWWYITPLSGCGEVLGADGRPSRFRVSRAEHEARKREHPNCP